MIVSVMTSSRQSFGPETGRVQPNDDLFNLLIHVHGRLLEFPSCPSCGAHDRTLGPAVGDSGRWSRGGPRSGASCMVPTHIPGRFLGFHTGERRLIAAPWN